MPRDVFGPHEAQAGKSTGLGGEDGHLQLCFAPQFATETIAMSAMSTMFFKAGVGEKMRRV